MDNNGNFGILMPEIILYDSINSILNLTRKDFEDNELKETILYSLFGQNESGERIELESFNFLSQSKKLFVEQEREIEVNIGYNLQVVESASIHIMMPNESGKPLSIGADQNYVGRKENSFSGSSQEIYTNTFDANYNVVITSPNTLEVLLIYHFIKNSFLILTNHIELSGLRDPKIGGQDIQLQGDLVPPHIFHRSLGISFWYENHVPDIMKRKMIKNFDISGITLSNKNIS